MISQPWYYHIRNKKDYDTIVSTGMAYVLLPDLPLTWEEAKKELEEKEIESN